MGIFVTFEGGEGSGKTTQIRLLKEKIESSGYSVYLTREPGGTEISEQIRKIILDPKNKIMTPLTELFLYEASRAQHVTELILPALTQKNSFVICDRFYDATLAYQASARSLGENLVEKLNLIATSNLKPNLTFYIDIEPTIGLKRAKKVLVEKNNNEGRFENESLEFHIQVRKAYLNIANKEKKRVKIIDGSKTIEQVHENIMEHLKCYLKK